MRAEFFLERIEECESRIDNKIDEIRRLEALAEDITSHLSEVKTSASPNPFRAQDVWVKLMQVRDELFDEVDDLIDTKAEVIKQIEKLPPLEYDVLYKIYVSLHTVQEVADAKNYTREGIYCIKRRAIEKLQKILDSDERVHKIS